jgi:hypothetical protein
MHTSRKNEPRKNNPPSQPKSESNAVTLDQIESGEWVGTDIVFRETLERFGWSKAKAHCALTKALRDGKIRAIGKYYERDGRWGYTEIQFNTNDVLHWWNEQHA